MISFVDFDELIVSGYECVLDLCYVVVYVCFDVGGVWYQCLVFVSCEVDVIVLWYLVLVFFGCMVRFELVQGVFLCVVGDIFVVFDGVLGNGLCYCVSLVFLECDGWLIVYGD